MIIVKKTHIEVTVGANKTNRYYPCFQIQAYDNKVGLYHKVPIIGNTVTKWAHVLLHLSDHSQFANLQEMIDLLDGANRTLCNDYNGIKFNFDNEV